MPVNLELKLLHYVILLNKKKGGKILLKLKIHLYCLLYLLM